MDKVMVLNGCGLVILYDPDTDRLSVWQRDDDKAGVISRGSLAAVLARAAAIRENPPLPSYVGEGI